MRPAAVVVLQVTRSGLPLGESDFTMTGQPPAGSSWNPTQTLSVT
jgi:hypothetical protein